MNVHDMTNVNKSSKRKKDIFEILSVVSEVYEKNICDFVDKKKNQLKHKFNRLRPTVLIT